jgi:hypothetical protein
MFPWSISMGEVHCSMKKVFFFPKKLGFFTKKNLVLPKEVIFSSKNFSYSLGKLVKLVFEVFCLFFRELFGSPGISFCSMRNLHYF